MWSAHNALQSLIELVQSLGSRQLYVSAMSNACADFLIDQGIETCAVPDRQ